MHNKMVSHLLFLKVELKITNDRPIFSNDLLFCQMTYTHFFSEITSIHLLKSLLSKNV